MKFNDAEEEELNREKFNLKQLRKKIKEEEAEKKRLLELA